MTMQKKTSVKQNLEMKKVKKKLHRTHFKRRDAETVIQNDVETEFKVKEEVEPEEPEHIAAFKTFIKTYNPRSTLLIKKDTTWYSEVILQQYNHGTLESSLMTELKNLAEKILQDDVQCLSKVESSKTKSQSHLHKTLMSHGTMKDKLAYLVMRCIEDPVHSLASLHAVVNMTRTKPTSSLPETLNSLLELFKINLLPTGKIARDFQKHNFMGLLPYVEKQRDVAERQLALWYFEDQLRHSYMNLIHHLSQISQDTMENNKLLALRYLTLLLEDHPKQDVELVIKTIVNKLGDPSRKVASRAMHKLKEMSCQQRDIKLAIVSAIEELLFRTNIKPQAQYYCLCFLRDIFVLKKENALAGKLVILYFGFYKACTKKGEVNSRLMGVLLSGMHKAYPYVGEDCPYIQEQLNALYRMCHFVNFAIVTQTLQLIYEIHRASKNHESNRFYQALYQHINDPEFGQSSQSSAFLNLLFRAMCNDESTTRIKAFIKRLLQCCHHQPSNIVCGILYLISEVIQEQPALLKTTAMLFKPMVVEDDNASDVEYFPDYDINDDGTFTVEVAKTEAGASEGGKENKDDTYFKENDLSSDTLKNLYELPAKQSSWVHLKNVSNKFQKAYNPYSRNPLYCGADCAVLWEIVLLKAHFHPTVALFAKQILKRVFIEYTGDPLLDFSVKKFLERFAYKNPKKIPVNEENKLPIPYKKRYVSDGVRGMLVTSKEFKALDDSQIPEDVKFFHDYFTKHDKRQEKTKDNDNESVDDDEFDEYLEQLSGSKNKDEDSDYDEDIDFASAATKKKGKLKKENQSSDEAEYFSDDDDAGEMNVDEFDSSEQEDLSSDDHGGNESEDDRALNKRLMTAFETQKGNSGEDIELGFSDSEADNILDFNEEDVNFSDGTEDGHHNQSSQGCKRTRKHACGKCPKRMKFDEDSDGVADAEAFAHLLEENEDGEWSGTSHALSNRDRAARKQLSWEQKRTSDVQKKQWTNKKDRFSRRRKGNHSKHSDVSKGRVFAKNYNRGKKRK